MRIPRRFYINQQTCLRYLQEGMPQNVVISFAGLLWKLVGYDPVADQLILQ